MSHNKIETQESLQQAPPRVIEPIMDRDSAFYWEGAKRGELVGRSCDSCGTMVHPPVPMCPKCHGLSWTEKTLSGRGKVAGWLKVHHPQTPMFQYPLLIVTVELEEGFNLISNLVDAEEGEVRAGLPVEVTFTPTRGGWALPLFRPRREAVAA